MNRTTCMKHAKRLALGLAALAIAATPSFAQTYDLCASDGTVTMPDSTVVPIWGYADITGSGPCAPGMATLPGPELRVLAGQTLTINLSNALTDSVSFFVPSYRAVTTGGSAGMFTAEVATGGTVTYELTARAGTYLYHSGTNIRTQVPMGLYGALVVDVVAGSQAYSDVSYTQDQVVLYSEIDPNLNADPANFGGARVINWIPQYYMINGEAQPATSDVLIGTGANVLLRFVNAGIQTYTPTLDGGLYLDLKAEDGNRYPQPLQQYGIELPAGKTIDAMVSAPDNGSYALYDRSASYDSGVTAIIAGAVAGAPTAVDDAYPAVEDTPLVVANVDGVLFNDSVDAVAAVLVSGPSAGTLVGGLAFGGGFTYQPNANFNGIDTFSYKANDGAGGPNSNVATVTITVNAVNDGPVAMADFYNAVEGVMLSVAAPGVLWNDTDVDLEMLTASAVGTPPPGILVLNPNGSFDYTPAGIAGAVETFDYEACDPALACSTATVTISVVAPADNIAPFANDDFASTTKNSAGIIIDVTANDVDADGDIDPTTVVLTTGGNTQRGGTVSVDLVTGEVTYVPKRGFRGTDTFKYTVDDNDGAPSNEATVRVNVS